MEEIEKKSEDKILTRSELWELYYEWARTQDVEYDQEFFYNALIYDKRFIRQFYKGKYTKRDYVPTDESKIDKMEKEEYFKKYGYEWTWKQDVKYVFYKIFQIVGYIFWGTFWLMAGVYIMLINGYSMDAFGFVMDAAGGLILGCVTIPISALMVFKIHPIICDLWWCNEKPCLYENTSEYENNNKNLKDGIKLGIGISLLDDLLHIKKGR